MARFYKEVTPEIIDVLKAEGFINIQLTLQNVKDKGNATVEVIPGRGLEFQLNSISLDSREILEYFDGPSPMAKYVIDQDYLKESTLC